MFNFDYHNPNDNWGYDPYKGMNDDERVAAGCMQVAAYILTALLAIVICAMFGSCTTVKYVPLVEHKTDTVWHNHTERDSIYVHDSTYIKEKGDTVLIEKWHTRWRDRAVHDTLYISKTDSVPKPYPVIQEVPAKMSKWQKWLMWLGLFTLLGGIVWVAVKVRRFLP